MSRRIRVDELLAMAMKALEKQGLTEEDSQLVINHLLDAELSGHQSHGFYRLSGIVKALRTNGVSKADFLIENDGPMQALINGVGRLGLVTVQFGTELAVQKVETSKIAVIGAYNFIGTTGLLGYYSRIIARNGFASIVLCNAAYSMAPWGGTRAILGTNPISISVPTGDEPIVADLATSAMSYGDLKLAMKEGRKIPEGIVMDENGYPSTNPHDADYGSQLPMAQHKGYALALMFEILTGPFVRAKAGREAVQGSEGCLILALDPNLFSSSTLFKSQVDALIGEIKSSPLAPGATEILLPGEGSNRNRKKNKSSEYIKIPEYIISAIEEILREA